MNRIVLFLLPLKFISARGHGTPCPYNLDQTCVPILQHLMFAFVALTNNYFNNLRDPTLDDSSIKNRCRGGSRTAPTSFD